MTNREFFLKVLETEKPVFLKVMKAVPSGKSEYKPHEKGRTAGSIVTQLAMQPVMISKIVKNGVLDFGEPYADPDMKMEDAVSAAEKNYDQLKSDLESISDEAWEQGKASMLWPGGKWESEKYDMSWSMLFDAIHHRGQLTTYLRAMGEKVPGVYGGSADEPV
jgi:uncharacterized damage-inducible protein DinB